MEGLQSVQEKLETVQQAASEVGATLSDVKDTGSEAVEGVKGFASNFGRGD